MHRVVLAASGLGLALTLTACAEPTTGSDAGRPSAPAAGAQGDPGSPNPDNPAAGRSGPLPDGGTAASCVENYSPGAVAGRSFAFDGTVLEIGPSVSNRGDGADLAVPGVTFEVHEWFAGGGGETVTVDLQAPTAAPAGHGGAYGIGSRLLVSGEPRWGGAPLDAPIAWLCGFSRYHDTGTATAWRDAVRP